MTEGSEAALLRIYLGEQARHGHRPLYEAIILKAVEAGLAGATVLRGPLGFGRSRKLHTGKILDLSQNLPMVVEIVDSPQAIDAFLPILRPMLGSALATVERVTVIRGETPSL